MSDDSYVFEGPPEAVAPRDNNPPLSISELSFALKRTLEDRFAHVRLRGEISKVNRHASGHVYLTLKDDKACIDGVIWKGSARSLGIQPETGLEVIVTGKITSYPARSSYQIVIETMEAAGAGALLAQLERLKTRLAGEGLFEAARKKPLPAFPAVIGVITSPTGAVIRDILHRIAERWPCRVIVWPVVVQGESACGQVSTAIKGFDALPADGPIPRPDLLIVARGGGSVEDLWCFNDERVARAIAACRIPTISGVGHEVDVTIADFVADLRAPTPTGAAEMVTPVLADLAWAVADLDQRLVRAGGRLVEDRRVRLRGVARGLPVRPEDLLALPSQRLDHAGSRLASALHRNVALHERGLATASVRLSPQLLRQRLQGARDRVAAAHGRLGSALSANVAARERRLVGVGGRLSPEGLYRRLDQREARLGAVSDRLGAVIPRRLERDETRLAALARALATLDPRRPKPGFARVEAEDGSLIAAAAGLSPGQAVRLVFDDGARGARIDEDVTPRTPRSPTRARARRAAIDQGDLF